MKPIRLKQSRSIITRIVCCLILVAAGLAGSAGMALAQIATDGSTGPKQTLRGPVYNITADQGTISGNNLFHSFEQFDIQTNEQAVFSGPDHIQNIISRITGGNASSIDGQLSVTIPSADLYLINPAGIIFGPNASLDLTGSFHCVTADYILFDNADLFYADPIKTSVLSSAAPAAFGFLNDSPQGISLDNTSLSVQQTQSIDLVGGDITLSDAFLYAPAGTVRLTSLSGQGQVNLDPSSTLPENIDQLGQIEISRSEDSLTGDSVIADVDVSGNPAGQIRIRGGNLVMDNAILYSESKGPVDGGSIHIDLSSDLIMTDYANILSLASDSAQTNGIDIKAQTINLSGYGTIDSSTQASARSGDVDILTQTLTISDHGRISSATADTGNAGNVNVNATESVTITGDYTTGLRSEAYYLSEGNAGDIDLETPSLTIHGGWISTDSLGYGRAGDILIKGQTMDLDQEAIITSSGRFYGDSGDIDLSASKSIHITDINTSVQCSTSGLGNAGIIRVTTPDLTVEQSGMIQATTYDSGNGGTIWVDTDILTLLEGGQIAAEASIPSSGKGGTIHVSASDHIYIQNLESYIYSSGITTGTYGSGDGGDIDIESPSIISDNGRIDALSAVQGNAGNVRISCDYLTLLNGGQVFTDTDGQGRAGNVDITATQGIELTGISPHIDDYQSGISSSSLGSGNSGRLNITCPDLFMDNGFIGVISASSGNGGQIAINAGSLSLLNGAQINARTLEDGRAGDMILNISDSIAIAAHNRIDLPSRIITSALGAGQGGHIVINTANVVMDQGGVISAKSSGTGDAGTVTLNISDSLSLSDSHVETKADIADGGDMFIDVGYSLHLDRSDITASVGGGLETHGGNITVDPEYAILNSSNIVAQAYEGAGGNISIVADTYLADPSSLVSASSQLGIDGAVDIQAPVINLSSILAPLAKNFLIYSDLLQESCLAKLKQGDYNSFVIEAREAMPYIPEITITSPMVEQKANK